MKKILSVNNLKKHFHIKKGLFSKQVIKAVDGVSFKIDPGETLGLVGESGCGKTTTAQTIMRLLKPSGGSVVFDGKRVFELGKKQLKKVRKNMQMVFQDPFASLNPRMPVGEILEEPLVIHGIKHLQLRKEKVLETLNSVGLEKHHLQRFPHELSGGQRQRVAIARALITLPKLIICDEPVSALDVSVQAKILNLLMKLRGKFNLSYLFISHDLSVIKFVSDRVAVMYLGKIVELASCSDIFASPLHPYTRVLISSIPSLDKPMCKDLMVNGDVPNPLNRPKGCVFHTRCKETKKICIEKPPEYKKVNDSHFVACHFR